MSRKVYIDQSAQDLALNVLQGHPNEEQFNILEQGSLEGIGLKVKASIIGASHMVELTVGDVRLCEVFSCEADKSRAGSMISSSFPEIKVPVVMDLDGVEYHFECFSTDSLRGAGLFHMLEKQSRFASRRGICGLAYKFPKGGYTQQDFPKTVLVAVVNGGKIELQTAHSYPNEETIVFTKTMVSIEKEAAHERS